MANGIRAFTKLSVLSTRINLGYDIARRTLSLSSQNLQLVNAPIQVFGTEGRYAHAVYSAAVKNKKLDAVDNDLNSLYTLLKDEPKLGEFLSNPIMNKQEKQETVAKILKTQKVSDITLNLFNVMAENGRLKDTADIIGAFRKIMSAHRGEVICNVTTATALDSSSRKDLEAALKGFLKPDQKLFLHTKVDASLLGGMVVEIGDRYVDMSTATKVKHYRKVVEEALTETN